MADITPLSDAQVLSRVAGGWLRKAKDAMTPERRAACVATARKDLAEAIELLDEFSEHNPASEN